MKDDRTCRSEEFWEQELERSGGQARPFCGLGPDELLAEAIDHAISAGACRVAARMNPEAQATWNAVADAKTRQAKRALGAYLLARGGRRRGA
jgi:hypothetical protein